MTHEQARAIITARIAALATSTTYADSSFALDGIAWAESPVPLVPEYDPPTDTLAPLAFWVDNRRIGLRPTRSGHDPLFVRAPIMIRFLYPIREHGPPNSDWGRAAYALEALVNQILDPTWAESEGDGGLCLQVDSSLGEAVCRFVGGSWLAWEHPFLALYERTI